MIPVSLKLYNFTSYGTNVPILDFTKFQMAAISGYNGAGKSSLLDAITWCLWGSSRIGDSADPLVRLGQTEMFVEFSFELDGHVYTVKRRRSLKGGGSTSLEFFSNSHNLTEGTIKATQQKIINTLHLTYETFVNSAFIRQNHADEFTTKGPSERKKILADILGLAHYDQLEEKAREKAKEAQSQLTLLDYQLLEVEAELSQKEVRESAYLKIQEELAAAQQALDQMENELEELKKNKEQIQLKIQSLQEAQERLYQAEKEVNDLKSQLKAKEQAIVELQQIINQKEDIEAKFEQREKLQKQRSILESKRSELLKVKDELSKLHKTILERENKRSQSIAQIQVQIKRLQTQNETLEKEIDHLQKHQDICPTCGQKIDSAKSKKILENNQAALKENLNQLQELEEKLKKWQSYVLPETIQAKEKEEIVQRLEEETKEYQQLQQQLAELEKYAELRTKLLSAEAALSSHKEALENLQTLINQKQQTIIQDQQKLTQLAGYRQDFEKLQAQITLKEKEKDEQAQRLLDLKTKSGEIKMLKDRLTQLEEVYQQKKQEKERLAKDKAVFEELALAFGKKGIQAMIIENAIPEIEQEANLLLDRLTEGRMKVSLLTQRENKTKEGVIETLDIIISDEMGERPYEMFSGGEAFRVNLALRLALSKLLTNRAGSKLQFLVIDEGFGTQDASGRTRIVEALDLIKEDFAKILIITHLDELKEEFPVRIEVSKGPEGSTFELIS